MKRIVRTTIAILTASICYSQQPYKIPFASSGNTVELAVANTSSQMIEVVKVFAKDIPSWIHLTQAAQDLNQLKPKREKNAVFTFSVDSTAPVNKEARLTFVVSTPSNETWTKEITISVAPPDRFELLQNYPNPFNPETNIEYTLPRREHVHLAVYDVLGREVKVLVDKMEEPGYKSILFDGSKLPSGVYFYRFQALGYVEVRKMMITK